MRLAAEAVGIVAANRARGVGPCGAPHGAGIFAAPHTANLSTPRWHVKEFSRGGTTPPQKKDPPTPGPRLRALTLIIVISMVISMS